MVLDGGPHLIDMAAEAKVFNFWFLKRTVIGIWRIRISIPVMQRLSRSSQRRPAPRYLPDRARLFSKLKKCEIFNHSKNFISYKSGKIFHTCRSTCQTPYNLL
jgi:hypothetical protein